MVDREEITVTQPQWPGRDPVAGVTKQFFVYWRRRRLAVPRTRGEKLSQYRLSPMLLFVPVQPSAALTPAPRSIV